MGIPRCTSATCDCPLAPVQARCAARRSGPPRAFASVSLLVTGSRQCWRRTAREPHHVDDTGFPWEKSALWLQKTAPCVSGDRARGGFHKKMLFSAVASCPLAVSNSRIADQTCAVSPSRAARAVPPAASARSPKDLRSSRKCVLGAAGALANALMEAQQGRQLLRDALLVHKHFRYHASVCGSPSRSAASRQIGVASRQGGRGVSLLQQDRRLPVS